MFPDQTHSMGLGHREFREEESGITDSETLTGFSVLLAECCSIFLEYESPAEVISRETALIPPLERV